MGRTGPATAPAVAGPSVLGAGATQTTVPKRYHRPSPVSKVDPSPSAWPSGPSVDAVTRGRLGGETTLFVVCGMPGAGKSVLARRLAEEHDALHLDPDEWFVRLGLDPQDPALRKAFEDLQWAQARRLLALGTSVVTESAGWVRPSRRRRLEGARALGVRAEIHVLDVPLEVRWERIARRNSEPGTVHISRAELESFERWWQPPTGEELAAFDAATVRHS